MIYCVLHPDLPAVTTAAQIPVCGICHLSYQREVSLHEDYQQRRFFHRLEQAYQLSRDIIMSCNICGKPMERRSHNRYFCSSCGLSVFEDLIRIPLDVITGLLYSVRLLKVSVLDKDSDDYKLLAARLEEVDKLIDGQMVQRIDMVNQVMDLFYRRYGDGNCRGNE